jgi:DNA-binding PadR family transcriptional regulator
MKTDLFVLAMIKRNINNGYDIMKEFQRKSKKNINLKYAAIYYLLQRCINKKWIIKAGSIRNRHYPEKYIYKTTPEGIKYIISVTRKYLKMTKLFFEIDIALMLLDKMDTELVEEKVDIVNNKLKCYC